MINRIKKHHVSFKNAIAGVIWVLTTQPNFQVHIILSLLVLVFSIVFEISYLEFLVILIAIVLGLSAEMINTAIEAMTDLITIEWRTEARIAKDVSAGMMLVVSLGTLVIGLYIFLPKLMVLFL